MNQTFTCNRCKQTGSVRVQLYEDAHSVGEKIARKHRQIAPQCRAGLDKIRAHSQLGIIKAQRAARKSEVQ